MKHAVHGELMSRQHRTPTFISMTTTLPLTTPHSDGELLDVPDRIVVAPRTGVFIPLEPTAGLGPGTTVRSGQLIGHLQCGEEMHQVTSPFAGVARDMLALPNERVRQYQPLLWMAAGVG